MRSKLLIALRSSPRRRCRRPAPARASPTGRCGADRPIATWCPTRRACRRRGTSRPARTSSGSRRSDRRATAIRSSPAASCSSARTTKRCAIRSSRAIAACVMAFRESDGEFLWQATFEKLTSGRANDWPFQGIASSPLIDRRDGVFHVEPRGADGGGHPAASRTARTTARSRTRSSPARTTSDVLWTFDTMEEVGNFPHNLANSSPTYFDNLLYISTGNGQDESHVNIPSPKAPAIVAIDMHDRQAGVGRRVARRQDPARPVVHAGGRHDRRRRAGRARPGRRLGARLRGEDRQEALGVRHESEGLRLAEDAQRGHRDAGHLRQRRLHRQRPGSRARRGRRPPLRDRRDQARRHHDRPGAIWHYDKIRRSISTASIKDGIIYYPDFSGFLHALDVKTGKPLWVHDMFAAMWSSTMVADGKVYLGDEDGDVVVHAGTAARRRCWPRTRWTARSTRRSSRPTA